MLSYVRRSVERSPAMMREAGDACNFLRQLGGIKASSPLILLCLFIVINIVTN
jgi:hypothetical protein